MSKESSSSAGETRDEREEKKRMRCMHPLLNVEALPWSPEGEEGVHLQCNGCKTILDPAQVFGDLLNWVKFVDGFLKRHHGMNSYSEGGKNPSKESE
jgi:hypothetical protein